MQQYDDPTAVAAMPEPPPAGALGWLTDGVPGAEGPTVIRAWIINLMIEELLSPITAAGIAPSRTDGTQLLQAIRALIAAAIANLQTSLGFTPVRQGGGPGQGNDQLNLGWDDTNHQLLLSVGGASQGGVALKSDLTAAIAALVGGAPGALDTLKELADAINDDASYAATITNLMALKAPLAAPSFTAGAGGALPSTVSPAAGDNSQALVPSSWVNAAISAAVSAVAHRGNASSGAGPWWDWDPVTGRVEVWGVYNSAVTIEGPIQVNFPVNIGRFDGGFAGANETNNTGDTTFPLDTASPTSMTFLAQDSQGGNSATAAGFFWRAWGYSAGQPAAVG